MAGYWGSPTKGCDAPPRLAEHTIDWIGDTWKEEIDFIVWTGDNARFVEKEKYFLVFFYASLHNEDFQTFTRKKKTLTNKTNVFYFCT